MQRILVIDDSTFITEILHHYLTSEGYEVLTAEDGEQGIEIIEKYKPELVVTDVIMPVKNGVEVVLHVQLFHPEIKIIAMSSGGTIMAEDHLSRIIGLGADYVLNKPFTKREFLSTVTTAIEKEYV